MKPLVIRFNKDTSERDVEDLMILLEDISKRYNFTWFKDTYAKDNVENTKSKLNSQEKSQMVGNPKAKENIITDSPDDIQNEINKDYALEGFSEQESGK